MGYESKIYIVRKSDSRFCDDDGRTWAEEIAIIDLCKAYELSAYLRNYPKTNCYIYADDGNTKIIEDRYGDALTEIPLEEAIQIVKNCIAYSAYWRYNVLLATLQSIYNYVMDDEDFVVLHYGY